MRRVSPKRSSLLRQVAPVREQLRQEADGCELCGHSPWNPWKDKPAQCSVLTVHEIARGNGLRQLCLDKRFACLVTCWACNCGPLTDAELWPIPRQLCLLRICRPADYDLRAFVSLIRPNAPRWITQDEVDFWRPSLENNGTRQRKLPVPKPCNLEGGCNV